MLQTVKRWINNHSNRRIGTYMSRWYIIPPSWNLPICVRLQHIKRADAERIPHNHPYAFKSVVLKGWYVEEQVEDFTKLAPGSDLMAFAYRTIRHNPFKVFRIAQEKYHRLIAMSEGGVWTLIWHPRKAPESAWGYLDVDGTHIPHDEYVRPPGYDLPYKTNSYRREGPKNNDGPGPDDLRGPGGPKGIVNTSFDVMLHGSLEVEVMNADIYNPKAGQKGDLPK